MIKTILGKFTFIACKLYQNQINRILILMWCNTKFHSFQIVCVTTCFICFRWASYGLGTIWLVDDGEQTKELIIIFNWNFSKIFANSVGIVIIDWRISGTTVGKQKMLALCLEVVTLERFQIPFNEVSYCDILYIYFYNSKINLLIC